MAAVLADRAFSSDKQKLRNLTENLSKMSNKTYSKAVIGKFKTLFRKRTNIPQFFHPSVTKVYLRAMAMPQRPVGLDMSLSQPNY